MVECVMATPAIKKRRSVDIYQGRKENMENATSVPNALRNPLLPSDQIGSFLRKIFSFTFTVQGLNSKAEHSLVLSPLQEERLQNLRRRLEVPFDDASSVEHQLSWPAVKPLLASTSRRHDSEGGVLGSRVRV